MRPGSTAAVRLWYGAARSCCFPVMLPYTYTDRFLDSGRRRTPASCHTVIADQTAIRRRGGWIPAQAGMTGPGRPEGMAAALALTHSRGAWGGGWRLAMDVGGLLGWTGSV